MKIGMFIRLSLASFFLALVQCAQEEPYLFGYLQRIVDAVMVDCIPYEGISKPHSCVILANAEKGNVFVYDASEKELVIAPNGSSPLRVRTGPQTARLRAVSNQREANFVFGIDDVEKVIYPIRLKPELTPKKSASFTKAPKVQLDSVPADLAVFYQGDILLAMASYPQSGMLHVLPLDKKTGELSQKYKAKTLSVGVAPSHLALDPDGQFLFISDQKEKKLYRVELANILSQIETGALKTMAMDLNFVPGRLYVQKKSFEQKPALYVLAQAFEGRHVSFINAQSLKELGSADFKFDPAAVYFPSEQSSDCCEKKKNWFAALSYRGEIHYVVLEKTATGISIGEQSSVELNSMKALGAKNLLPTALIGGAIRPIDGALSENECSRKMFATFAFAADPFTSVETEALGWACEGTSSFVPLGTLVR